jgi:chemotaxis protein CheD
MRNVAEHTLVVGLGEVRVTDDPEGVLVCLGLGSCVGVCAYDPVAKIGGMAHIMLPSSTRHVGFGSNKHADLGVPALVGEMTELGASASRLIVKIAGGAQMSLAPGVGNIFKVGENNIEAVKEVLSGMGIRLKDSDTGGNHGRTMRMHLDSGAAVVTSAGRESIEL